jgi:hypothetical protein
MPKKKIDFNKMARTYAATNKMGEAMVAGGYSATSSQRGKASMSHTNREKFAQALDQHMNTTLGKFADIGKEINAQQQENWYAVRFSRRSRRERTRRRHL